MKKVYSMLVFAAAFASMTAQTSPIKVSPQSVTTGHREFVTQNNIKPQRTLSVAEAENVIVTPPADAEIKMYTRTTLGYSVRWGQAYQEGDQGIVGEIAYCDNGDVYLRNPISFNPMDSWIKGKKEGNTLTFTFPQLVAVIPADEYDENSEMMEVWLNMVTAEYGKYSFDFGYDENTPNEITMTIDDDGKITYSEEMQTETIRGEEYEFPTKMMALTTSNHFWLGYGDFYNVYEPFDAKPAVIPEGVEALNYAMTFGDGNDKNGKWVKLGFDDDNSKIYIAGIYTPDENEYDDVNSYAIVGDLFDGGMRFKSRQYVGIDPYYYHAYVSGGTVSSGPSGSYLDVENEYYMTMDSKRSKITSASTLVVSEGEKQGYVLEYFIFPIFDNQTGYIDPTPAEPLVTGFMPYVPENGYGGVRVMIPNTNRNGQLLHEENLSYSIVINDNVIVFDPENYPEFSEPTSWIPFNFSSYNVEISAYEINTRMVFMTEELYDVQTISVQSRYKDNDTYYVTNGQTYIYKLPKFAAPTFDPESGYEFDGEEGEVTITAPEGAILAYRVITPESGRNDFIDSASNIEKVTVTGECFIQAYSKDPEGDDERTSDTVTAMYVTSIGGIEAIIDELDGDSEVYTMQGVRVERETLTPGLYIVKKSGKATRVLVK